MATKYSKNIQTLLNSGEITKIQANNIMRNTGIHTQSNNINITREKKSGLPSFSGRPLKVIKNRNNIQNKLKNKFMGKYTHIKISGSFNQCYARTTLFVLLLYINRNANSFREFLRIVNSEFSFKPLEFPSLIIDEQSIRNSFSHANIGELSYRFIKNVLFNDIFIDNQDGKKYEIFTIKKKHARITNKIKINPLEITLICKEVKKYGGYIEIKLKDYITDRYVKLSFIERNRIKIQQIEEINRVMGGYYNKEKNKELVIETFINMYNNSKLFNNNRENKILRDYFKYWRLKIQIIQGTSLKHITGEIKTFLGGRPYVVFITEFLRNISFFNSLVFYNYNDENKKFSISKYGKSISLENLERNLLYDINAPVLVGTSRHQEVAVNNKFFADLNKNNWPKYEVEPNIEFNQHHNNGGVGKPKSNYLEYPKNINIQPEQDILSNANRTKMRNFLKSKIGFFNNLKTIKKKSINQMNDTSLLNDYLIEKTNNKNIVRLLIDYYSENNTKQKSKNLELTNANRTKMKEFLKKKIGFFNNLKDIKKQSINGINNDTILLKEYLNEKTSNKEIKDIIEKNYLKSLLETSNKKQLNEAGDAPVRGGTSFVYVSKIGRRKLRYTKKGRKFIINKGKRKYLK